MSGRQGRPSTGKSAIAPGLVAAISLFAGVLSLLFSGFFWARFHVDIPVADTLRLLRVVQSFVENGWGGVTFQEWVSPHSGAHRIAVGRLLMALEYRYLAGGNSLFYLGSWVSIGGLCYLYSKISTRSEPPSRDLGLFMLGLALILLCGYTSTYNLIVPINTLWYIGFASSAVSFYILALAGRHLTLLGALGAGLFAVLAAYCVFTGVITCLLVAVLALRSRTRYGLLLAILMVAFVAFYLPDVKSGQQLVFENTHQKSVAVTFGMYVQSLVEKWDWILYYTILFLGSPLSISELLLSCLLVMPSFFLIILCWIKLARRGSAGGIFGQPAVLFYLAMATLCLGTAVACFLGREFLNRPADPRYQTVVMVYWLSIGGLILHVVPGRQSALKRAACMLLVLLIPAGLFLLQSEFKLITAINWSNKVTETEIRSRMGFPEHKDPALSARKLIKYYSGFESFLSKHSRLRADAGVGNDVTDTDTAPCDAMKLVLLPDRPGSYSKGRARLVVEDRQLQRFRRVTVLGPEGDTGYLYAVPTDANSPRKLLWDDTPWKGYYPGGTDSGVVTLVFDAIFGPDFRCQLKIVH